MKRTKTARQRQTLPAMVFDARGVTLSAGVAAFDEALVKRFKDLAKAPADAEQITPVVRRRGPPGRPRRR